MKIPLLAALLLLAPSALAAGAAKLAPAGRAQVMMGDVGVMANAEDERCNVVLFDDKVEQGYRIDVAEGCAQAFPVMAKVKAWRVYGDGSMSFADAAGNDLIRFRGKGYKRKAVEKVDGIKQIWSAQEVAE
jgi:Protease inhibitor Inh